MHDSWYLLKLSWFKIWIVGGDVNIHVTWYTARNLVTFFKTKWTGFFSVSLKSTQLLLTLGYKFTIILIAPIYIIVPHSHKEGVPNSWLCTDSNQIICPKYFPTYKALIREIITMIFRNYLIFGWAQPEHLAINGVWVSHIPKVSQIVYPETEATTITSDL